MTLAIRDARYTRRVGAVSLVVLTGLIGLLLTYDGCDTRPGFGASVYFGNLGGLREGADVQVAGRVIGAVTSISLVSGQRSDPDHPLHPTGGAEVRIRIEDRFAYMAPVDGEYFVSSKGLLGEQFLEIGPRPDREPSARHLRAGDRIRGIDPPLMDRAIWRGYRNLIIARSFADEIAPDGEALGRALTELSATLASLESTPGELSEAAASIVGFTDELRKTRAAWAASDVSMSDIDALARSARDTMDRLDAAIDDIRGRVQVLGQGVAMLRERVKSGDQDLRARLGDALARADRSLANVQHIVATVRELAAMVQRGQGTIGALANDPEFPEDAKQLGRIIKRRPWKLIGRPKHD